MTNPVTKNYMENRIRSANQMELVIILYEGAIQQLSEAKTAIQLGMIERKTSAINLCSRFITEMQAALDLEKGGLIAASLSRLYRYFQQCLVEANMRNSMERVDEVQDLLRGLLDSWNRLNEMQKGQHLVAAMNSPAMAGAPQRLNVSI